MEINMLNILFTFAFFSILGWLLEVFYRSFRNKRIVNPGLLKGPYLIIYGTGALLLTIAASKFHPYPLLIKALIYFIITTGLELLAGLACEYLSIPKLWDYSDERFNYRGIICLKFSIYWILLAFVFEYTILPPYLNLLNSVSPFIKSLFATITISVMFIDFVIVFAGLLLKKTPEEKKRINEEFNNIAKPILELPEVRKLSEYNHHNGKTRLEHVIEVAYLSFLWGKRFSLDCKSIVRGALLHDLFHYDWLREGPRLHGFRHPKIALDNASRVVQLTEKEKDIIKKHMWPLTPVPPRYAESLIVALIDTYCSVKDYLKPGKQNIRRKRENMHFSAGKED